MFLLSLPYLFYKIKSEFIKRVLNSTPIISPGSSTLLIISSTLGELVSPPRSTFNALYLHGLQHVLTIYDGWDRLSLPPKTDMEFQYMGWSTLLPKWTREAVGFAKSQVCLENKLVNRVIRRHQLFLSLIPPWSSGLRTCSINPTQKPSGVVFPDGLD